MSYEIGTSTSATDLLDKIRVVALARGWTVNTNNNISASEKWISLQIGTSFYNLYANNAAGTSSNPGGRIFLNIATGYDNAQPWNNQPNQSNLEAGYADPLYGIVHCNDLQGPFTSYRIFSMPDYIHIVVERSPDNFIHIMLGKLTKYGAYTGGEYITSTYWTFGDSYTNYPEDSQHSYAFDSAASQYSHCSMNVRCYVDSRKYSDSYSNGNNNDRRVIGSIRSPVSIGNINSIDMPNWLPFNKVPNSFNQITPFLPIILYVGRGSDLFSPIGEVQDIRIVNMKNYNPGDIVTFGSDQWVVFPVKQKTISYNNYQSNIPSSANYGYAYRKIV